MVIAKTSKGDVHRPGGGGSGMNVTMAAIAVLALVVACGGGDGVPVEESTDSRTMPLIGAYRPTQPCRCLLPLRG